MKKGFTLIELLAVIVILAIIALIATPLILNVINDVKRNTFNIESQSIEKATENYLIDELKIEDIPKYKEYYIPVSSLRGNLKNIKDEMLDEYVIVKKTDKGISYYYTGRDKNPYLKNKTLKEAVESDTSHIRENVKVNGVTVNKVIGTKTEKNNIKNWVWYSGQLWQVLETNNDYVKMITANGVSSIAYGPDSEWNTSWVRKWLNEIGLSSNEDGIFYHHLSRTDLLLDGNFCLDEPTNIGETDFTIVSETRKKVTSFTPIDNCNEISTDKIGLMTFEDYVYSLNGVNGITGALGGSYLDEDELSWTMTKYTVGGVTNRNWHTYYFEPSHIEHSWNGTTDYGKSVRPVIYLSSELMIEENNESNYGTVYNPYRLIGEQKSTSGNNLNGVTIGSYIYLSEQNNPYTNSLEYITSRVYYIYNKAKVRYRVIGVNNDGSIKVQRSDLLKGLPSTVAIENGMGVPYYHKPGTCDYTVNTFTECVNNNYFKPKQGTGSYAYMDSENIGYFLNNADNSYYNWLSDGVKSNILEANWSLPVGSYRKDYAESLFNFDDTGEYPIRANDGIVSAKIGLPQWGDMFSGNDLNYPYWYINRWEESAIYISTLNSSAYMMNYVTSDGWLAVRPVLYLKSSIKITGGEGTPANPYTLSIE